MPELEKNRSLDFYWFSYLKLVLSNYHSDFFVMLWLRILVYCDIKTLSTWEANEVFLVVEFFSSCSVLESYAVSLLRPNSHCYLWATDARDWRGPNGTVDTYSHAELGWHPAVVNLLQEGPIWISGMPSMLRGHCLVQRDSFSACTWTL